MSKEPNPYEVLHVDAAPLVGDPASPYWYSVEGDLLVCGSRVILPDICIFTGSTENLVANPTQAQYPSFRPVIVQRSCNVTYYTSKGEYRRRRRFSAVSIAGIVAGIMLIFVGAATESDGLLLSGLALTPLSFLARFVTAIIFGLNLRIARYERSGIFRIRGFPQASLAILVQPNLSAKDK